MASAILTSRRVSARTIASERRRYRKISCRMWGDEKFRALSRPQPNAQTLWMYLLTGPHTTAVPGLFTAGELQLAEALGWSRGSLRRCVAELVDHGMIKFDVEARVIWIMNMIRHNPPDNPNVVKHWITLIDEVPASPIKEAAIDHFVQILSEIGESFVEPFRKPFRERFAKPFGEPSTEGFGNGSVKQEQEQEHEHDPPKAPTVVAARASKPYLESFTRFWSAYPRKIAKAKALKAWAALKPDAALVETILAALAAQSRSESWLRDDGRFIPHAATWLRDRRWEDVVTPSTPPAGPMPVDDLYARTQQILADRRRLLAGARGGE